MEGEGEWHGAVEGKGECLAQWRVRTGEWHGAVEGKDGGSTWCGHLIVELISNLLGPLQVQMLRPGGVADIRHLDGNAQGQTDVFLVLPLRICKHTKSNARDFPLKNLPFSTEIAIDELPIRQLSHHPCVLLQRKIPSTTGDVLSHL